MQDTLKLQKVIVPEMVELLEKRYNILRTIHYNEPIGRRVLASNLGLGERIVRTEINFLKTQNLIQITTPGMYVTKEGENILEMLKEFIHEIKGLSYVESSLKELLNLKDVIIVPGSLDEEIDVYKELGKAAANYIKSILKDDYVLALTGGSTIREVVDHFPNIQNLHDILIVPARGGMGKNVETQANTLAGELAKKVNGSYKMLHIPANAVAEVVETLSKQKDVKEIINYINNADILLYGIGDAEKMAFKRGVSDELINDLLDLGAIGEALGFYFDKNAKVVSVMPNLGIDINKIKNVKNQVAVAGGRYKAEAIMSAVSNNENVVLVLDEGAAKEIIKKFQQNN